jgi:hypothetical protein
MVTCNSSKTFRRSWTSRLSTGTNDGDGSYKCIKSLEAVNGIDGPNVPDAVGDVATAAHADRAAFVERGVVPKVTVMAHKIRLDRGDRAAHERVASDELVCGQVQRNPHF